MKGKGSETSFGLKPDQTIQVSWSDLGKGEKDEVWKGTNRLLEPFRQINKKRNLKRPNQIVASSLEDIYL